jgi:hypothetical protein
VKIGYIEQVMLLTVNPAFFSKSLTLGTVTIATGVVRGPDKTTGGADIDMTTQPCSTAIGNSSHHFALLRREHMAAAILCTVLIEDLLDFRHQYL